ncbi:MAG: glycosyltransferase [Halobacteriales archaeon]
MTGTSDRTPPAVAAFTDTYLPTINGVTYTISAWRDRWADRGGRMDVIYPASSNEPEAGEYPVRSLPFPFYDGFRLGLPQVPDAVGPVDLVHSHSPFSLGFAGYRMAQKREVPFVVSYHTPIAEYAEYVAPRRAAGLVSRVSRRYESVFLDRADLVLTPSESTRSAVASRTSTPVRSHPNGVDVGFFAPTDPTDFLERYGLPAGEFLVGYTGRHGYEKNLDRILDATADLEVTVVFGGDGPARESLERLAGEAGVDARFLGFLDREELPEFYSAIDVFAFPSPVETQGLVALESIACGTPVVAVDSGALSKTVTDGSTGYHYEPGSVSNFREKIERAKDEGSSLSTNCLDVRQDISLDRSMDHLESAYRELLAAEDGGPASENGA